MVYCGKPSKGCQMCRTRRIKCDETKPTCNQCAKSRRQCPGYKDEFDLVFRNETQATERRARKAGSKKALALKTSSKTDQSLSISPVYSSTSSSSSNKSPLDNQRAIIPSLNIPVEHQASCHFVANFILVPSEGSGRGFMDFVIPLLRQEDQGQGHLRHAFNACSMAFLNNRGGTGGRFADKALHEYTKALNGTNAALRSPEMQLADSTLAAVLLLGLFESITAKQIGMLNWGSHTEGAIQLVRARGKKQLKSNVGLALFAAVRTQMIIHSLTSGTAPIMGAEWWIDDAVRDGTAAKCHRLMIKTGELRAEVTRLMSGTSASNPSSSSSYQSSGANVDVMLDMIRRVQAADREVVAWMRDVPEEWSYRTVAWEDGPTGAATPDYSKLEVFPGRVDVYRDFYIASVWNTARTARLVLASLVVRCAAWVCSPVDYRTTPEYATAARTCVDTITDIIASVPYHLGWHLRNRKRVAVALQQQAQNAHFSPSSSNPSSTQSSTPFNFLSGGTFGCGDDNTNPQDEGQVKALAGYFLTWPLICLVSQDYTTDAQRSWIGGRLAHIGDALGVKYAHILRGLQIRIPSMLIRRDGLMMAMAGPYGAAPAGYARMAGPAGMGMARLGGGGREVMMRQMMMMQQQQGNAGGLGQAQVVAGFMGAQQVQPQQQQQQDPLKYIEALQRERFEKTRAELLARAAGGQNAGEGQKWVARLWLTV
ncbi:uncharacterized protein F4822DRAFT_432083 [Hypoxylon trugodes]|uniref:uncharacterized protein n=1 Tax=Hypoxylon trugodes TaxID=326681 RepID=UPI002193A1DC|nr:uncharacterized protein F4822DRAFT_432083 [Hypoxylon trugodes]KAI1385234.1 hypothetical protein F4822DRAFT_432083 [Hypoxylon trugodes]